jgi:hypothetical protein
VAPGSLELVREPQRVGEASQGARQEIVGEAGFDLQIIGLDSACMAPSVEAVSGRSS